MARKKGRRSSISRSCWREIRKQVCVALQGQLRESVTHPVRILWRELVYCPANPSFQRALNACYWEKRSVHVARIFSGPT